VTTIVIVTVVTEGQDIVEFAQLGEVAEVAMIEEFAEVEEFAKGGGFELKDHIVGFAVAADVENNTLDKVSIAVVEAPVDVVTVVSVAVGIRQLIVPY
jgi:hypothetical protein